MRKIMSIILLIILLTSTYPYALTFKANSASIHEENASPSKSNIKQVNIVNSFKPFRLREIRDGITPRKIGIPLDLVFRDPVFMRDPLIGDYYIPLIPGTQLEVLENDPVLPVNITVIKLPYDVESISVELVSVEKEVFSNNLKLMPSPRALLLFKNNYTEISDVLSKINSINYPYPMDSLSYRILRGIDPVSLERYSFLVIKFYPLRILSSGQIEFIKKASLKISYYVKGEDMVESSSYNDLDAVIITGESIYSEAVKLARFKNDTGTKSVVVTIKKINSSFTGRDLQEKIRNYIKYMVNTYGVKFVILFGDSEIIPPRYVWVPDGAYDSDESIDGSLVETDLYYADLDYSWDSNNDGLWGDLDHDKVDGLPDILIGRIPVSNSTEAEAYLSKLFSYKPTTNWFNSTLMIGTDTFGMGAPEGEYLVRYIEKFIPSNYTVTKLLETVGNLTLLNMISEINQGYGYINYAGHGDIDKMIIGMGEAYTMDLALRQINRYRPSIIFSMACLTGRFANLDGIGESFIINPNGGAIAYVGSTRLAWGYIGDLVVSGLSGEMNWRFAKALFSGKYEYISQVWAEMISGYIWAHPIKTSLSGYYIDWKTVTEFVLLGDPTLSIRISKTNNMTQINLNDLSGVKELRINNSTVELTGNYHENNSNITIENSTIIMKNASIILDDSNITLINSIITGDGEIIINGNSHIQADLSVINPSRLILNRSELVLNNSSLIKLYIMNNRSRIELYDSVAQLDIYLDNLTTELNLSDGYYAEANFTDKLNYNIYLERSYIGFTLNAINSSINLADSEISQILSIKSKITISNAKVNNIILKHNSTVEVIDSIIGLEINLNKIEGSIDNLSIRLTNFTLSYTNISGFDSEITTRNTTVCHIALDISNSSLNISDSIISSINAIDSSLTLIDSYAVYMQSSNSSISVHSAKIIYLSMNLDEGVIDQSDIKYLEIFNSSIEISESHLTEIRAFTTSGEINRVFCYYIYSFQETNITINGSRILSIISLDTTNLTILNTRFALMYARDKSRISLRNVTNTFGIRLFDESKVYAVNSTIWPELILINKSFDIHDLSFGFVKIQLIENNWSLLIEKSYVLGWDILAYSSKITVAESSIFWLFAFYGTRISVFDADVSFLRLTDNSTAIVKLSSISQVITAETSEAILYKTMVGVAVGLGSSRLIIAKSVIGQVIGFMNSSIDLKDVIGGIVAPLDSSRVTIQTSKCSLWLEIYDKKFNKSISLINNYYEELRSEDLGLGDTSWELIVKSSLISWVLVFVNSSVTIDRSKLFILEGIQSNLVIKDTKIINFMGYYQSNITISNTVAANITAIISSKASVTGSSFGLLSIYHSEVNLTDTVGMISIIIDKGESTLHLYTGLFNNIELEAFGTVSDESLIVRFDNTSVLGWYVLTLGNAKLNLVSSNLISIGAFENSQISISNSFMYGYLEIFDNAEITAYNTKVHYLYLSLVNQDLSLNNVQEDIDYLEIDAGFHLKLSNIKIIGIDIDAYLAKLTIIDTGIIHRIDISNSIAYIIGSKIESLKSSLSIISITNSKVNTFKSSSSTAIITDSIINDIIPGMYSSVLVRNSDVGVTFTLFRRNKNYRSLQPGTEYTGVMIGENWNITLINTKIKKYSFMALGYANLTIQDSKIAKITIMQFASLSITNITSSSVVITDEAKLISRSSIIGLELNYYIDIIQLNISEGYYREASIIGHNAFRFDISLISTNVFSVNITMIASNAKIINSKITFIIIDYASDCDIISSNVLYVVLGIGSKLFSSHSELRIIVPFQSNGIFLEDAGAGLTKIVFNYNESIELPTGKYDEWGYHDIFLRWSITIIDSDLYDWRVMVVGKSFTNVTNTHVLAAYADGESRMFINDCILEMPPMVDDYAEIHVLWSLKINVVRDFQPISNAKIKIFDSNRTLVSEDYSNENGSAMFLLHQAIITRDKRIDLGHYKIYVSYEFSSASKDIYLWHSMEIQVYLIGYITIISISAIIAVSAYLIYLFIRKKIAKNKSSVNLPKFMDFLF